MREYRIVIGRRGQEPFWHSTWADQQTTERRKQSNQELINRQKWDHEITIEHREVQP